MDVTCIEDLVLEFDKNLDQKVEKDEQHCKMNAELRDSLEFQADQIKTASYCQDYAETNTKSRSNREFLRPQNSEQELDNSYKYEEELSDYDHSGQPSLANIVNKLVKDEVAVIMGHNPYDKRKASYKDNSNNTIQEFQTGDSSKKFTLVPQAKSAEKGSENFKQF